MGKPIKEKRYSEKVSKFSGSGNPIVTKSGWDKRVVVVVSDGKSVTIGNKIKFTIDNEHSNHYQATAIGDGESKVSKPDYNGSPNIPIHHDGKHGESVGDTRGERESFQSPEDRESDHPGTWYAPKLDSEKPDRTHLE